jgi:hypothetical protein
MYIEINKASELVEKGALVDTVHKSTGINL